jgi:hypothetical protein
MIEAHVAERCGADASCCAPVEDNRCYPLAKFVSGGSMFSHLALMMAASSLIVVCMFYPFLPGDYDGLAVTLSAMAQLFAMAGLVLVPLGAIWLPYEIKTAAAKSRARPGSRTGYWFGLASICAATIVAIVVSFGAGIDQHQSLGLVVIAIWAYVAVRLTARLKAMRDAEVPTFNPAPIYLVVLPIVAAVFKFTLVPQAAEFSRNRAIDDSSRIISDIERYRDTHGHYPQSLQSLWDDYRPSVIGVKGYCYEPNGEYYNLFFEHFAVALDMKEIVMYNQRDEQDFSSHNSDLLLLSAPQIRAQRGHVAAHDASRRHWKYFLFD